jgi:hypothetical protein
MAAKIEVWHYGIGHRQHLIRASDFSDVEFLVLVDEIFEKQIKGRICRHLMFISYLAHTQL